LQSTKEEFKRCSESAGGEEKGGCNPPKRNLNKLFKDDVVQLSNVAIHQRGI